MATYPITQDITNADLITLSGVNGLEEGTQYYDTTNNIRYIATSTNTYRDIWESISDPLVNILNQNLSTQTADFWISGSARTNTILTTNVQVRVFNNGTTDHPVVDLQNSRGTETSPTYLITNDEIGAVVFRESTSGSYHGGAGLIGVATENWDITKTGSSLGFFSTPKGTNNKIVSAYTSEGRWFFGDGLAGSYIQTSTIDAGNPDVLVLGRTGGNIVDEGPSMRFDDFAGYPQAHIFTKMVSLNSLSDSRGKLVLGSHGNSVWNDELTLNAGTATFSAYVIVPNLRVPNLNTAPSSSIDTGMKGEVRFCNGFIYLCVDTDTWQRSALTTW